MASRSPHCLVSPALGPTKPLHPESPCSGQPAWTRSCLEPSCPLRAVPGARGPASATPTAQAASRGAPAPLRARPPQMPRVHVCARLPAGALRSHAPPLLERAAAPAAASARTPGWRQGPCVLTPRQRPARPGAQHGEEKRGRGRTKPFRGQRPEPAARGGGGSEDVRSGRGRSRAGGPAPCSSGAPWRRPRRGDG